MPADTLPAMVRATIGKKLQEEELRIARFGDVRAPISQNFAGHTFVAVGSRLLANPKWKTFHDFLFSYIVSVVESDWFRAELDKRPAEQHPLVQWYHCLHEFQQTRYAGSADGAVRREVPTAPVIALLAFAYDLYTLEHHSLLPPRLVDRIKLRDQFQGARYETYVAAAFVRAGFSIVLEDESDTSTSHCEFTAVHRTTGSTYSVEAKSRHRAGLLGQAGSPKPVHEIEADISGLLSRALRKNARNSRIVFIDVNCPPEERALLETDWFNKLASQLKRLEATQPATPRRHLDS